MGRKRRRVHILSRLLGACLCCSLCLEQRPRSRPPQRRGRHLLYVADSRLRPSSLGTLSLTVRLCGGFVTACPCFWLSRGVGAPWAEGLGLASSLPYPHDLEQRLARSGYLERGCLRRPADSLLPHLSQHGFESRPLLVPGPSWGISRTFRAL